MSRHPDPAHDVLNAMVVVDVAIGRVTHALALATGSGYPPQVIDHLGDALDSLNLARKEGS